MTQIEARGILAAFESGYIDVDHPDVVAAQTLLGKNARIVTYQSWSNPHCRLAVRRVGEKSVSTVHPVRMDHNGTPFQFVTMRTRYRRH